jgi:ATP-dependent Zn protease
MNTSGIKRKISNFFNFLIKIATDKKTWILLLGMFMIYKMKNFPREISTSQFMQYLNSSKNFIKELYNLNNNMLVFETLEKSQYICHYPVTNVESFNAILLRKEVEFECFSGFRAFIENPYNHIYFLSAAIGMLSANVLPSEMMKYRKYFAKKSLHKLTEEEIFSEFIANENVKNQIKVIIDQLKNPEKYEEKNIKLVKGVLVYGKPGTGKTLLARVNLKIML